MFTYTLYQGHEKFISCKDRIHIHKTPTSIHAQNVSVKNRFLPRHQLIIANVGGFSKDENGLHF